MKYLPGLVLWLFLLVYLAYGQLSDKSSLDTTDKEPDNIKSAINDTYIQENEKEEEEEEEKENDPTQGEAVEIGEIPKQAELLINKISTTKPILVSKPQDFNGIDLLNGRDKRRRTPFRTVNASELTEIPVMSQERRNSYLSIAERRKYYNRTRTPQPKKVEIVDVELDHQETTNKLVSTTETLHTNEIRVSKKPIVKETSRVVTERKNETNNQRVPASVPNNETYWKPQSTRQSVIQSQYQFGQKLNLRKAVPKPQDGQDGRRKKEKSKIETVMENSTNKLNRNYPTQSTKLLRVDKNLWEITTVPDSDVDVENFVMHPYQNDTVVRKLAEYVAVNKSAPEVYSNKANSTLGIDKQTTKNGSETKVGKWQTESFLPLPLNYQNSTAENVSLNKSVEADKHDSDITNLHNQEILKLNNSNSKTKLSLDFHEYLNNSESLSEKHNSNFTDSATTTTETALKPFNNSTTAKPSLKPLLNAGENVRSVAVPAPVHSRNGKFSNYGNGFSTIPAHPTILKSNLKGLADGIQSTTPFVRVIPKESATSSGVFFKSKIHRSETNIRGGYEKVPVIGFKERNSLHPPLPPPPSPPTSSSPTPQIVESWSSTEGYPLTIELNENNKRVLSEMFQTSTTSEPKKIEKEKPTSKPTTNKPSTKAVSTTETTTEAITTTTTTTTTTSSTTSTTTESPLVSLPDEEDHKAQGTQYNTKFYIAPNNNRSQVIKIVENDEDDDENEVGVKSRSAGVAIYVLSAFGLVPLLLALIFATKFMVQRYQRQYECESDGKSDISTNESQTRQVRKKKGSTDLKKSPSNVTTTTLVTTTRLPRVQHWENCDKQGNKSWEFPRSKIKLKTILGQGNFGQVWKAEAEDMAGHEGVTRLVAVKTVKEGATEKEHAEFIKELEIMQQIGSHPNIVTLLGCCTDQEPYYLIMEYVKYGKLLTFLREHRVNENYYNFSNNSDALTSRDLTVFAYCVARGMEYLASRGIIHRDLAARNVLVDHTKLCKIADFGMSRSVRDFENGQVYEERQHKGALPIRWMAPESLVYSVFTYKSDVWSFGIVMWEIVTLGSTPYPNMGAREVMRKVRDGYRLERPSHCKPEFYRLISHCWAHDPNKRPDFSELRHELSNLLDNPTKDGSYVDLDRFAVDNNFHIPTKTNDLRLLERNEFKTLKRLGDWDTKDWHEGAKKSRVKRGRNNGKGTVTLTGQGSFTVNSRILEKEFKMI